MGGLWPDSWRRGDPDGQFLKEWLETTAALPVSALTLQGYRSIVRSHLIPRLGNIRLDQLTPKKIEAPWVKMGEKGARKDGRGDGGLHPRTMFPMRTEPRCARTH
jgi:integrase